MPVSGNLDKDWIDQNYAYLEPRLGTFPVFEPSAGFYADLAELAATDARVSRAAPALRRLFAHAGLPGLAVRFGDHTRNAGEFRFSQHPDNPDLIVPDCIRIAKKYRLIEDPQRRGMAIGTILAHEIAHYSLLNKKIHRETTDTGRLTDLCLVVLGFSKLWFNGRSLVAEDRPEQTGYLKPPDMTYAFMEYARKNSIPEEQLKTGLTPEALQLFSYGAGMVATGARYDRQQEGRERAGEAVRVLAREQADLEANVQAVIRSVHQLESDLAAADENQEIINRTRRFWDIPSEDHRVMEEFVNARATGARVRELAAVTRLLDKLRHEVHDLGTGLKQPPVPDGDPEICRHALVYHRQVLAALRGRADALRQQVDDASSVHERCFSQMGSLHRDVEEIRAGIREGLRDLEAVGCLDAFLSANPVAWPAYTNDGDLRKRVLLLTRPEAAMSLAALEQELEETGALSSLARREYAGRLERSPPLQKVRERLGAGRDRAVRDRQEIAAVRSRLEQVADAYLYGARQLELRLGEIQVSSTGLLRDIRDLKLRQDRITERHDHISVSSEDDREFAVMTRAICSWGPEDEYYQITARLASVKDALMGDVERVKRRKAAGDLLPLEAHKKGVDEVRYALGSLSARVSHWMRVQQGYLDRPDAQERPSARDLLRTAGHALLYAVRASVTKKRW